MATKTSKTDKKPSAKKVTKQTAGLAAPHLVIVESPAKARTINKYLGSDYIVKASMGHVRDLPERGYGVDLANGFEPTYKLLASRKKVIGELRKAADKAELVFLATDLDREGEAIAWHLCEALEIAPDKRRRVVFNEITKTAITEAFAHAHEIDVAKVDAQQARRILDRIVGYELSPLLWQKIAKGLSAGRVQSVAVLVIVEREKEIRAFVPTEQWQISACFTANLDRQGPLRTAWEAFLVEHADASKAGGPTQKQRLGWLSEHEGIWAELVQVNGETFRATAHDQARAVVERLGFVCDTVETVPWEEYAKHDLHKVTLVGRFDPARAPEFRIREVSSKRTRSKPPGPFTTASLQQAASTYLRFAASRTMRVAQQLYEGLELKGEDDTVALITYMRTDSTNLSADSVAAVRTLIDSSYGSEYVPEKPNTYGSAKRAQEAHEAVRPTEPARTPASLKSKLPADQWKLYELIWKRFVACQMQPAEWDSTTVLIGAAKDGDEAVFRATGRRLAFDGYLKVAGLPDVGLEQRFPTLEQGQSIAPFALMPRQTFTAPPPRFNEASLVKSLEAEGIGRPSTYAAIIDTIQKRGYVEQEDRRFHATALGERVTDKLVAHFPKVLNVKFTAFMEDELDKIEETNKPWVEVLHEFYDPFHEDLVRARDEMEAERAEPSDHVCDDCGKPMVYRWSKTGRFLACSGYPDCKSSCNVDRDGKPVRVQHTEHACEKCGKSMILRKSRHGPFLGCSGYPECRGTLPCSEDGEPFKLVKEEDIHESCELCDAKMAVKWRGARPFLGCSTYPTCKSTKPLPDGIRLEPPPQAKPEEAGLDCEKCGKPMVIRGSRRGKFLACTGYPRCRNTHPVEKLDELKAAAAERAKNAPPPKPAGEPTKDGEPPALPAGADARFETTKSGKLVVAVLGDDPLACPQCGEEMVVKPGRWGPFLSCTGYPRCKNAARLKGEALKQAKEEVGEPEVKPKPIPTDIECGECGTKMVIRTGRSGQFLGCGGYPKCRNTQPVPPELIAAKT